MDRWARPEYRRLSAAEGMPPATHSGILVERDIPVPAEDGTTLLTDHWYAEGAGDTAILVRTPYGRRGGAGTARFLAERGHHVIVQSCRGTFGSGGRFNPLRDEAADGQAAMRWLRRQHWATGRIQSWGFSYVGLTQWALCDADERPDAMVIGLSSRRFDESIIYPGGPFAMETGVVWCYALSFQERAMPVQLLRLARATRNVKKGSLAIPPEDAVLVSAGSRAPFFEDWLAHAPGDPWWEPVRFAERGPLPPITLLAGWQDLFLLGGFADYLALRDRGETVRLIAGDWTHQSEKPGVVAVRELLRGFAAADVTDAVASAPPVQVEVTGTSGASGDGHWRDLAAWPPPATPSVWQLGARGALTPKSAPAGPAEAPGDLPGDLPEDVPEATIRYRYDPADPTPQAGGRSLNPFVSGRRDQRPREERADVLVFTSEPLREALTVIGAVDVELTFASTNPQVDFFVRLCDADEKGVSSSITDTMLRMTPDADAARRRTVTLTLSPTAHRFAAGHSLRLQVSSGAHPLHLRNPGTDDPTHDFSRLVPSEQTIVFGGATPSLLRLPVVAGDAPAATSAQTEGPR